MDPAPQNEGQINRADNAGEDSPHQPADVVSGGAAPGSSELFKIVVAATCNFVFAKQPFQNALDSGTLRAGWSSF